MSFAARRCCNRRRRRLSLSFVRRDAIKRARASRCALVSGAFFGAGFTPGRSAPGLRRAATAAANGVRFGDT